MFCNLHRLTNLLNHNRSVYLNKFLTQGLLIDVGLDLKLKKNALICSEF